MNKMNIVNVKKVNSQPFLKTVQSSFESIE